MIGCLYETQGKTGDAHCPWCGEEKVKFHKAILRLAKENSFYAPT